MNQEKDKTNISDSKVNMKKISPILQFLASMGGRIVLTIVFAAIVYGILIAALRSENMTVLWIAYLCCGFFGWKSLNKITPNMFLWMPLASWVFYYLIKGILSCLIGAFIAPFWLGKKISSAIMDQVDDIVKNITE